MPLFDEQIARKPNHYPWTEDFKKDIWAGFWTAEKFTFASDYHQFKTELTDQERQVVTNTLSAIGQIEVAVKTFWAKLGDNLPHPSLQDLGLVLAQNEVIHNDAYEKLLDRLGMNHVFEENLKLPVIAGRVKYLRKYLKKVYGDDHRKQYIYALILFTLFVENVSLFSQFYVIMWFNRFRHSEEGTLLKECAQQVQYTRNEESLHAQIGIKIINTLRKEYPELFDADLAARIVEETKVAFEAECDVIDWMVGDYTGPKLSAGILKSFVAYRLNESLRAIGYNPALPVNPAHEDDFYWMVEETIGGTKTDFFHKDPTEYTAHDVAYSEEDIFG
jgi:ribonucleoside-diphosphate reductase beta chain